MSDKKEYIDREALKRFPIRLNHYDKEHGNEHFVLGIESVLEYAESLPAADVAEVQHGYWYDIVQCEDVAFATCSVCNNRGKLRTERSGIWYINNPYCPICGTKMDGGNK